ncbi:MAG TPA: hypothetical protein VJZ71_18995 [Phycisphaerae bacterium]|nr:hypothetical protein [Phycisphaerae bacterium]
MWKWFAGWFAGFAIAALVSMLVAGLRTARRRRRLYQDAMQLWQQTAPQARRTVFRKYVEGLDLSAPAWYLLGCAYLQEGRPRLAARAFGVAHHADYRLETAALLTFACLKAREGPDSDIIDQTIQTWHEMREPDLARHAPDRLMLDGLASMESPPALSPLGQLIWLTVSDPQRRQVEKRVANGSVTGAVLRG